MPGARHRSAYIFIAIFFLVLKVTIPDRQWLGVPDDHGGGEPLVETATRVCVRRDVLWGLVGWDLHTYYGEAVARGCGVRLLIRDWFKISI